METRRSKKRKSPAKDFIFEVSDNDMSPDNSSNEDHEPDAKVSRTNEYVSDTDKSNLENTTESMEDVNKSNENDIVDDLKDNPVEETISENMSNDNMASCKTDCTKVNSPINVEVDSNCIVSVQENISSEENVILTDNQPEEMLGTNIVSESSNQQCTLDKCTVNESDYVKEEPSIYIKFANTNISNIYMAKFLQFITNFVDLEVKTKSELHIEIERDTNFNSGEWVVLDETVCETTQNISIIDLVTPQSTPAKKVKKRNKHKKKKTDLFIVDTNPADISPSPNLKYDSKFMIGNSNGKEEAAVNAMTCFNCNGGHSLKDCPLPKDYQRINEARKRVYTPKLARYHLEDEQKYAHLAAGKISEHLRRALGLSKNQIPPYVYSMRHLGYPPGWLEEAKIVHSNLAMFDIHGKNVKDKSCKKHGLNPEKIIEYPGFNMPLDKGFKDEYHKYPKIPPYSPDFSKEQMMKYYENYLAQMQDNTETTDMDIDASDFEELDESKTNDTLCNESLNTLELQKQKLLDELNNSNETCDGDKSNAHIELNTTDTDTIATIPVTSITDTYFGTPILKSTSAYVTLPNPDNFSRDVSPVINFENLPNSTGKYEQMTGVIQKVRDTLKSLQNVQS